jgi:hypothetical protein
MNVRARIKMKREATTNVALQVEMGSRGRDQI